MKTTAYLLCGLLAATLVPLETAPVSAQETITIRTEHDAPSTSRTHQLLLKMADEIAQSTDGRIKIEVHSGASLSGGKIPTMVQNLQAGNEELALISSGNYSTIEPRLGVLSLPFMNGSIDDLEYLARESGIMDEIYADQGSRNIHIVDAWTRLLRQIVNNKRKIISPDDMAGLRFRVPEIKLWIDAFRAMGATPVPMPFSEIPTALQLGTIDGAERPTEFLETESWWDMAKYVSMVNYTGDVVLVAFNKPFWDKLDPETQELLTIKLREYGDETFRLEKNSEAAVIEALRKNGMVVTEPTPDQVKAFRKAMQPVWQQYENQIGKELIQSAESALAAQ